jgi:hypothetical protein
MRLEPRSQQLVSVKEKNFDLNNVSVKIFLVVICLLMQITLGYFLGHQYDTRIFMATGFLVADGQNPYIPQELQSVFNHSAFIGLSSIGYPPTWPIVLGTIYKLMVRDTPNFLILNLAMKLPVIASNIFLSFFIAFLLARQGVVRKRANQAWVFLLFSPVLFYFSSSWGQIDSLVALLAFLSLYLIDRQLKLFSALILILSISIKPITWPVLAVILIYLWTKSRRAAISYFLNSLFFLIIFVFLPFLIFNWSPDPIISGWNNHFTVAGGLSLFTIHEFLYDSYELRGHWWLVSLLWIPSSLISIYLIRNKVRDFEDLISKSLFLVLVFFLSRTWLSEPNVILPFSLAAFLTFSAKLDRGTFTAFWVLPLFLTILNNSFLQLLFPSMPNLMDAAIAFTEPFRYTRLLARSILVIPWHLIGWIMVIDCYKMSEYKNSNTNEDFNSNFH